MALGQPSRVGLVRHISSGIAQENLGARHHFDGLLYLRILAKGSSPGNPFAEDLNEHLLQEFLSDGRTVLLELLVGEVELLLDQEGPELGEDGRIDLEIAIDQLDLRGCHLGATSCAGDLDTSGALSGLETMGELEEGLAGDQPGDETRGRARFDAEVWRDAIAAIDFPPHVRQLDLSCSFVAAAPVSGLVVVLQSRVAVVTLYRAAGWRVVSSGRQREGIAAGVAKRHDRLDEALAERRLPDDEASVVVLNGARHDLRRTRAVA